LKKNDKQSLSEIKDTNTSFMNTNKYFPEFGGSTGGWLEAAETEEKYVMTWTNASKTKVIFEMPTGGAAIMKQGPNLVYFARKEQCLALGKQLRTKFKINDYRVFRLFPSGEIQFIHPKDGVFPEKVNAGRVAVGKREFSIGKNPNPASVKFTGSTSFET
jgi:photosystem I subunit 2